MDPIERAAEEERKSRPPKKEFKLQDVMPVFKKPFEDTHFFSLNPGKKGPFVVIAMLFLASLIIIGVTFGMYAVYKKVLVKKISKNKEEVSTLVPTDFSEKPESELDVEKGCKVGGCSNELCLDEDSGDVYSICLYKLEYECYRNATCTRQADGECGWTMTDELRVCLEEYQNNLEPSL